VSTSSCGCVGLHDGMSHAEHMDRLWADKNRALYLEASNLLNRGIALMDRFQAEEVARLQAKGRQMEMEVSAHWRHP